MADPLAASPKELVRRISERLHAAADMASAAETCAEVGNANQALALLRDIELPLYEVATLLNAASILRGYHANGRPPASNVDRE
jgi:hypothetical protein